MSVVVVQAQSNPVVKTSDGIAVKVGTVLGGAVLPADVAFTDVAQTFTKAQTFRALASSFCPVTIRANSVQNDALFRVQTSNGTTDKVYIDPTFVLSTQRINANDQVSIVPTVD